MDIRKEQTTMEPGTPDEQALAEIHRRHCVRSRRQIWHRSTRWPKGK